MIKKFIFASAILILSYLALIQWKMWYHVHHPHNVGRYPGSAAEKESSQRVYSFSFSKYTEEGQKELEIEGDSADILAQDVSLINVIAKAYAEESPVTITADQGSMNRSTNEVLLHKNVVATTENGTRLLTDSLKIHSDNKSLETDTTARDKKDNIHIEGMGASSDSQLNKVTFKKNVTVVVQDPNSETNAPTIVTSDGPLEVDYKRDIAHFSKNVVAHHERGILTSDYMDVIYDKKTRKVSKIIARGNVIITSKDGNITYSDNAVYLADQGRMILGGDVEAQYRAEESGLKN